MIAPIQQRRNLLRRKRGQGMTEYIIIVALIAIAAIGVITLFGENIRRLFGASTDALAGNTDVTTEAQNRMEKLEKNKSLENFGKNNTY
jgi:pilus assembly protein Flp/PilA